MAGDIFLVSQFVAAGAMFLLAGGLLYLNFQSRVNRAFALFLFFRGMVTVTNRFRGLAIDAGEDTMAVVWQSIREYYSLAVIPALLYFLVVYARPKTGAVTRWVIVALALLVEGLYAFDHCLDQCTASGGNARLGPLAPLSVDGFAPVAGLVGLWLVWDATKGKGEPHHRAALIVASALILISILEAILALFILVQNLHNDFPGFEKTAWLLPSRLVATTGILPAVVGIVVIGLRARTNSWLRHKTPIVFGASIMAALSGAYVGSHANQLTDWMPGIFILGLWRILLPALVAYALVRHRLFGFDVRIKWTLNRGFIAAIFLAVFFVVAQVAQNMLNNSFGWAIGGVAAGLLMFGLTPLQRIAERFSQAVMPHTKPVSEMAHPERLDLFREQAFLVWSDGTMGPKERSLLDQLRDRLGVSYEDAARIEHQAAKSAHPVRRPQVAPA
ncbi:MAG TPA: hypothetical protein VI796_03015 [Candidatus Thermoplasmatota archaeon]|nr:hypothetical protein [Candidatus Thermoplasmatota archaeon]